MTGNLNDRMALTLICDKNLPNHIGIRKGVLKSIPKEEPEQATKAGRNGTCGV